MRRHLWAHSPAVRLILDVGLTELSLLAASMVRPALPFGQPLTGSTARPSAFVYVAAALIWSGVFYLLSIYDQRDLRGVDEAQSIAVAGTLSTLVLASLLYFTYRDVSRLLILCFYAIDLVALVGFRLALRIGLKWAGLPRYAPRRVLILGAGEGGCDAAGMIRAYRWAGLEPVGFLDDTLPVGTQVAGLPVLGTIDQTGPIVGARGIDEVVIALPLPAYDRLFALLDELHTLPARVRIVPDHIKTTLFRTRVQEFAGVPMIALQKPTLTPVERRVKRAFDLIVGSLFTLIGLPIALLTAVAIRLDTPGPVIFRQERVGESGKLFWMLKFRSMVRGAEQFQPDIVRHTEDGVVIFDKQPDDPRITRVGHVLRRLSLDELPQLLNVLKGEMSLVGPRPELPVLAEGYQPWQWQRLAVPQGLTGWWQVNGRSEKPLNLHSEDDLFYIQNYSLLLDVQILWRTAAVVFKRQGAY